jgi:hypothetical protein
MREASERITLKTENAPAGLKNLKATRNCDILLHWMKTQLKRKRIELLYQIER